MTSKSGRAIASTGSSVNPETHKLVVVSYDKYEIVVRLTEDDRFLGIAELRINRDFLTPEQRISTTSYLDVDEFYQE